MKGMEKRVLLGIVLFAILLAVILVAFILPILKTRGFVFSEKDFRWYCTFWAKTGYKGTVAIIDENEVVNMNPYCTQHLGVLCVNSEGCLPEDNPSDPLWEKCRNACMLKQPSE